MIRITSKRSSKSQSKKSTLLPFLLVLYFSKQLTKTHSFQIPYTIKKTKAKPTTTSPPIIKRKSHAATSSNLFRSNYHDVSCIVSNRSSISSSSSSSSYCFVATRRRTAIGGRSIIDTLKRINRISNSSASSSSSSTTSLQMVLTTPSSIIEQASTIKLLDDLIDESVRTVARKTVMMQFNPSSGWIWRRWKGTVFSETWRTCVINMLYASLITLIYYINKQAFTNIFAGFNVLWGQLLSVTTFTLTFFLNQSYALWRNCYGYSRRLQGRLNDLNMTLAAHAKRVEPKDLQSNDDYSTRSSPLFYGLDGINGVNGSIGSNGSNGTKGSATKNNDQSDLPSIENEIPRFSIYTEPAREVLELMARYTRVFNLFTYASFTGSHRPLLTPQGMRRLVDRGIITESERVILSDVQLPVTQRHNALLLWMMRLFQDARKAGHLDGGGGLEQQFLEKCHVIRAQYGAIGDELQGRMPLAYAHIVQVLVDVILWMYPFMAFSTGMTPFLSVLGTGLLTMFYQGLFNLAKQFLDPYDNESYGKGEDPLCIDTLIAESNAGSVRWMNGLAEVPYSVHKVASGNLLEYQLPLRGWTIEQTLEREKEAEEAAMLEQTLKEQEEAEKRLAEEAGLIEPPLPILEIDEDVEELMRGEGSDEECQSDEDLTMEEALEKMEECTEKVP